MSTLELSQTEEEQYRELLQAWYREAISLARDKWAISVTELPVIVDEISGLNVTVSGSPVAPTISISAKLVALFALFDRYLLEFGYAGIIGHHAEPVMVQEVLDVSLELIFKLGPIPPNVENVLIPEGFDDYVKEMLKRKEPILPDFHEFRWLVDLIVHPNQQGILIEWQVKFLFLHELAHIFLRHMGQSYTGQQEIDADEAAMSLLLEHFRSMPNKSENDLYPVPFILLFIAISFVEDMIDLLNSCTEYVILDDFKKGFRPIVRDYPPARQRIASIFKLNPFAEDALGLARTICMMMDYGLLAIKDQIQHGLIDLKYLKWYSRVRAEEMSASFSSKVISADAKAGMARLLKIQRGWVWPIDFTRGPLHPSVLKDNWFKPVLINELI